MSAAGPSREPGALRRLYQGWLQIAARFGEAQTLVLLFLVYVCVLGPMALVTMLARRDLLDKRSVGSPGSAWRPADTESRPGLERAGRMF